MNTSEQVKNLNYLLCISIKLLCKSPATVHCNAHSTHWLLVIDVDVAFDNEVLNTNKLNTLVRECTLLVSYMVHKRKIYNTIQYKNFFRCGIIIAD